MNIAMKKIISLLTVFFCSLSVFAGMSNSIEYNQLYIVGTAVKGGMEPERYANGQD